ncbi:MAG: glycosyltransferase, partial [Patescibacteria group bacterium]
PNEKSILAPWVLVHQLADGLVGAGHDVTLFAAKGSVTKAALVHGGIGPTIEKLPDYADPDEYRAYVMAQELALMREVIVYAKARKLDIVHIHQPVERLYPALLAMPANIPVVITFHDPIVQERFPALEKLVGLGNIHFVSLSKSQQSGVPFLFAAVVPNGVDTNLFVPDTTLPLHNRPLLITGRIVPQKGFVDAIKAAKISGMRLMIVGQEYAGQKLAHAYFEKEVKPAIDGKHVLWESIVKQNHLVGHYQTAAALLFPIQWEEPFGLVMIEAMACGTPVIAYNRGSVQEIIVDGKTGFIVEDIDGMVSAIKRIGEIDRSFCRRHVEKYFTIEKMVEGYEKVYAGLICH